MEIKPKHKIVIIGTPLGMQNMLYNMYKDLGHDVEVIQHEDILKTELCGWKHSSAYLDEFIMESIKMPRDNNCKENHERGLEKRKANFQTQQTIRTMDYSPEAIAQKKRVAFFNNVILMLFGGIKPTKIA